MRRTSWAELRPKIVEMVVAGTPSAEIASLLGQDYRSLCGEIYRLRRQGLLSKAPNAKVCFTPEMDEVLRASLAAGKSFRDHAATAGISVHVIERRARELGLKSPAVVLIDWSTANDKIREMRRAGASFRTIAAAVGVGECTIRRAVKQLGLPERTRAESARNAREVKRLKRAVFWTEERFKAVLDGIAKYQTFAQIAIDQGVTKSAISGVVSRLRAAGKLSALPPRPKPEKVARSPKPRAARKVRSVPAPAAARKPFPSFATIPVTSAELVPLQGLREGMCRWPFGDRAPFGFCGCRVSLGSYCPAHAAIAHPAGKVAWQQSWALRSAA